LTADRSNDLRSNPLRQQQGGGDRLSQGRTVARRDTPGARSSPELPKDQEGADGDLFQIAGSDNIFSVQHAVQVSGDHLVIVWADAVAKHLLLADVVN
jgi:hypothetical protein